MGDCDVLHCLGVEKIMYLYMEYALSKWYEIFGVNLIIKKCKLGPKQTISYRLGQGITYGIKLRAFHARHGWWTWWKRRVGEVSYFFFSILVRGIYQLHVYVHV
jgi:hypothetical protein